MLSDTSPEAERVWIELWRKATPERRLERTLAVTDFVVTASRAAIAKARPDLSPREQKLFWVENTYGRKLADELREHLNEREQP